MNQTTYALAIATSFLVACTSNPDTQEPLLVPPPAGQGIQYAMQGNIAPGAEVEQCKFVRAPADGLWVQRQEVRFAEGSHHFLLYETSYTDIPSERDDGTSVDTSGVFDCSDGPTNGWSITRLVGGSQNADGDPPTKFPSDVALRVQPNAVLMMNAHYLNTTSETVRPDVNINLWTLPEEEVTEEGDILFWYNVFINSPANSAAQARMRCTIPDDVTLTSAQSHMHSRGVGFEATIVGDEKPFYTNDRWENVAVADINIDLTAGTTVEYACSYQNNGDKDVFQGPTSKDEMCMLIGSYYPTRPGLSFCAADSKRPLVTNALGAEWVGQGETSCSETLGCLQVATLADDFFTELQKCVAASDPKVSREVSDGVRCMLMSNIDGEDPLVACEKEIAACVDA